MAIYELKLVRRKVSDAKLPNCVCARDAGEYLRKYCYKDEDSWREQVYMLALDSERRITGHFLCSIGGSSRVALSSSELARTAILAGAKSVVLAHNHPGGDPTPGRADIETTSKVRNALKVVDIVLEDHIILGDDDIYSFADERVYKHA